ncbi:MAG: putative hybrid histidine [Planctomycetota bacterium]|nr:MAG: putative hybrid histidine [Planctomycetota bacterium]
MNGLDQESRGPGEPSPRSSDPAQQVEPGLSAENVRGPMAPDDLEWVNETLLHAQKMEALGRLAAGVAHDFNNLLTVIMGVAELRADLLPAGNETRADFDIILGASERASHLTKQLLQFARSKKVEPVLLDAEAHLRETERMLRRVVSEDIAFVTHFNAVRPWVFMDPMELDVVVMNLVINARDAMPSGGKLTISCANSSGTAGDWLEVRVKDTGTGMTEDTKKRLFQPFFTTKEIGRGTGLGLAACNGIVSSAGGEIRVETEVGKGSEFIVSFPLCAAGPQDTATKTPIALVKRGGGETLMLVEDDPAVRRVCAQALRQQGYQVLCACDGIDALAVAERQGYAIDLLVSDLVMNGMGGQALYERLQSRKPALRVLFMSGYNSEEKLRSGAIESEKSELLPKPFAPGILAQRVRAALDDMKEAAG